MSIIHDSKVNGPGNRLVIWTQGCQKGCHGCFNTHSWNSKLNQVYSPKSLAKIVKDAAPDGLTLSGGDPLEQPHALLEFLLALHDENCDLSFLPRGIILFTGYTWKEIQKLGGNIKKCVELCDVVIDGRYIESLKISDKIAGSSNQQFHFLPIVGRGLDRIKQEEVFTDQGVEIHIDDNDIVQVTGFPSLSKESKQRLMDKGITPVRQSKCRVDGERNQKVENQ